VQFGRNLRGPRSNLLLPSSRQNNAVFRLSPWCTSGLRHSWMLYNVSELFVTDVSGQSVVPIFKDPYVLLLGLLDPCVWEQHASPKRR
jgi:hypothetical protein